MNSTFLFQAVESRLAIVAIIGYLLSTGVVLALGLLLLLAAPLAPASGQAGGTIGGSTGAAALLGMKPSTLRSRLQALGLAPRK